MCDLAAVGSHLRMSKAFGITLVVFIVLNWLVFLNMNPHDKYLVKRAKLLQMEESKSLGANLVLSPKETRVNDILMDIKWQELNASYANPVRFLPSLHFFEAKPQIEQSEVFSFIRRLPKGASLHTHLLASVSVDFIMQNISHQDNLYGGYINGVFKLRFLADPNQDNRTMWRSIKDYRLKDSNQFDAWLKQQLSLVVDDPKATYGSVIAVWTKFKKIFTTCYEMLCYRPVFEQYVYQALSELYFDNVMYAEFKGTFMPLYELNQTVYSNRQFFEIFVRVVNRFKLSHPTFAGVRYIHSIYRGVQPEILQQGLDEIVQLQQQFPDFIAGFDFVGFEEEGQSLVDFSEQLLQLPKQLKLFFHAGETNWYGHTDLNLADAILLNSSRIGHGFALIKHPLMYELARDSNIALEICPISNQILMLNDDPRNHPASHFISTGYPVVVCNDDPSIWDARGLSYDWYVVFMAMTSKSHGLKVLKQLAINSLEYSALTKQEKQLAMVQWNRLWDQFLNEVLAIQS